MAQDKDKDPPPEQEPTSDPTQAVAGFEPVELQDPDGETYRATSQLEVTRLLGRGYSTMTRPQASSSSRRPGRSSGSGS